MVMGVEFSNDNQCLPAWTRSNSGNYRREEGSNILMFLESRQSTTVLDGGTCFLNCCEKWKMRKRVEVMKIYTRNLEVEYPGKLVNLTTS